MTETAATETALSVRDLCFSYADGLDVLHTINLSIQTGERVGVMGLNGSGKSTLFLLLCGILTPTSGKIFLFDQPVRPGAFHPAIGLVFQNPNEQLFCPTVAQDVAFGPHNLGLSRDEVDARVAQALATTGVAHLRNRVPHHLSGGEKRMVAIAGVLAMQPRLMLYDEPDANLDMRARRRLLTFLHQSQETFVLASHDAALLVDVCHRLLVIEEGRIVADGEPAEVCASVENHLAQMPDRHHDHTNQSDI
jgi:cobalt/nickel transport system ATP-binding protein